jgi:hypothetical protein
MRVGPTETDANFCWMRSSLLASTSIIYFQNTDQILTFTWRRGSFCLYANWCLSCWEYLALKNVFIRIISASFQPLFCDSFLPGDRNWVFPAVFGLTWPLFNSPHSPSLILQMIRQWVVVLWKRCTVTAQCLNLAWNIWKHGNYALVCLCSTYLFGPWSVKTETVLLH